MELRIKPGFAVLVAALAALISYAGVRPVMNVVWLDFDMQSIPEPQERRVGILDNFFKEQIIEGWKQETDIPRWVRAAAKHPKPAADVNDVDEVPDSSWYTNRHHLRPMTIEQLVRGPNQTAGPDFNEGTITKAKSSGVTPGLQVEDAKGDSYLIKFDNIDYPELQSAAEVISTKILYASGYNVPENYIAYIDAGRLRIGQGLEITDADKGKRPFARRDLDEMLQRVARMPDGRYRVLASKILSGKPKGPFAHVGIRRDDPNDLIPHEHRRELRGLRVISSWINHWDLKEENSLDMYVEEHGRKFLRHYLIDFGSTMGAGQHPLEYFHGREYLFDSSSILKEVFTLGLYTSPSEKEGVLISPQVGPFSARDFDPGKWKTTFPVVPFANMTPQDAFWATRIILSFTEPELRGIVEAGGYTDPKNTDYVLRTLLERRAIVARHWMRRVNPIAQFTTESRADGLLVAFHDLMTESSQWDAPATDYTYQIEGDHYKSPRQTTRDRAVFLDRRTLGEAVENSGANEAFAITIWTNQSGSQSDPVKIYLYRTRDKFSIGRISRG